MSAGTIPELRLSPTVPAGPIDTAEAPDPVLRRLIEVCESAVDPLEIAAAIEAEGLGDRAVRTRYGFADVFAMADHLWRTVPRQPTEPPAQPDPWRGNTLRGALHGLLYGLPAVFFPAGVGLLADPGKQVGTSGTVVVLGVSMLSSWPASQAVASLGYTRAGRLDVGGARRLMRLGLVVALLAVLAALAVTALVVPVRGTALAFGVGQAGYMLGASVLMVLGSVDGADPGKRVGSIDADPGKRVGSVDGADRGKRVGGEQLLLVALAPGVLVGGGYLLLGRPSGLA
ncbi:MAG: hypothetical protein J2O49_05690, partial [Sciscionella sp.]|nr:hypothetical protein [Sciscionella sp.]